MTLEELALDESSIVGRKCQKQATKKSRVGLVHANQSSTIMKKSIKHRGRGDVNESQDRSPARLRSQLDDNSMILTGGAPIEPTLMLAETPVKKGPHYPSIHNHNLRND